MTTNAVSEKTNTNKGEKMIQDRTKTITRALLNMGLCLFASLSAAHAQTPSGAIYTFQYTDLKSFSNYVDFSSYSGMAKHNEYETWTPTGTSSTYPYLDFMWQKPITSGGECWEYTYTQQSPVPMPNWKFFVAPGNWIDKPMPKTSDWVALNGTKLRLWVKIMPGSVHRDYSYPLIRLSTMSTDPNSIRGAAWLNARHFDNMSEATCEGSGSFAAVRFVDWTPTVIYRGI